MANKVRVKPLTEAGKIMRHPLSNSVFADEHGTASWPNDQFTQRRIRDGDVELVKDDNNK